MDAFRLTNLTGVNEIGANCYLFEWGEVRVIVDCGAHPKKEGRAALPRFDRLEGISVSAIFLTHAHQDHLGSLPVLTRMYPGVPVFMTEATRLLADAMLRNSVNVMFRRKEEAGIEDYPLFTHRDVTAGGKAWRAVPLNRWFNLRGERAKEDEGEPVLFRFHDAGHILGSVSVEFLAGGKRVLYTGDINLENQTMMQGASLPTEGIDVLVVETTRGQVPTPEGFTRKGEEARFIEAINAVFSGGGSVLVPVFALGKTQELLLMLHHAFEEDRLKRCPIYIGGLSTKLTEIHDDLAKTSTRRELGLELLEEVDPFTIRGSDINNLGVKARRIYALSSGMMSENTLSNVVAERFLSHPQNGVFFVGYADPETPGGALKRVGKGGEVKLQKDATPIRVQCRIEDFQFSAHGTRETILSYIRQVSPSQLYLVHGDTGALRWFAENAVRELPDAEVFIGDSFYMPEGDGLGAAGETLEPVA
ncbi:MAG: putative exonuclease of the beta-lactamase fold involved in processing [Verrucomicrobiota bacterium]|jgi:Cft2 family RNA processing exonuclease